MNWGDNSEWGENSASDTVGEIVLKVTNNNEWLRQNGYESNSIKDSVMEYYVRNAGYFVALKVNMSAISNASQSTELEPINISYKIDAPILPTRLLGAMPETMNYVVYILSAEPYIIL